MLVLLRRRVHHLTPPSFLLQQHRSVKSYNPSTITHTASSCYSLQSVNSQQSTNQSKSNQIKSNQISAASQAISIQRHFRNIQKKTHIPKSINHSNEFLSSIQNLPKIYEPNISTAKAKKVIAVASFRIQINSNIHQSNK